MGVWIETMANQKAAEYGAVTPCVGVWIETAGESGSRARQTVTPCVGVWIETPDLLKIVDHCQRHTLRGCVD